MIKYLLIIVAGLCAVSCTVTQPLYNWKGYDEAVYAYTKSSDEKSMEALVHIYETLIENSGGSRQTPPPGVCADYGYIMIKKGDVERGKELLNKEIALYPESKPFIDRILKRFEK